GGVTGTGNITFTQSSSGVITASTGAINNIGTITNSITGPSVEVISAPIGTGVTTITQNSTNAWTLSGVIAVGAAGKTIASTSTGLPTVSNATGITGTGAVSFAANSTGTILVTAPVNNVGTVTNIGSNTGVVTVSGVVGANVQGITQNSSSSQLMLSG